MVHVTFTDLGLCGPHIQTQGKASVGVERPAGGGDHIIELFVSLLKSESIPCEPKGVLAYFSLLCHIYQKSSHERGKVHGASWLKEGLEGGALIAAFNSPLNTYSLSTRGNYFLCPFLLTAQNEFWILQSACEEPKETASHLQTLFKLTTKQLKKKLCFISMYVPHCIVLGLMSSFLILLF